MAVLTSAVSGIFVSSERRAGLMAVVLGAVLFLATGFAAPDIVHNAAHDTRHAMGLPCH